MMFYSQESNSSGGNGSKNLGPYVYVSPERARFTVTLRILNGGQAHRRLKAMRDDNVLAATGLLNQL